MEIITGVKSPRFVAKGHKYSTTLPWNGKDRTLLLRASDGDPSPQVCCAILTKWYPLIQRVGVGMGGCFPHCL
jgi:hypothetical protein